MASGLAKFRRFFPLGLTLELIVLNMALWKSGKQVKQECKGGGTEEKEWEAASNQPLNIFKSSVPCPPDKENSVSDN